MNSNEEVWKYVEGYNKDYKISNKGRIKTCKKNDEGTLMSPVEDYAGYLYIPLTMNNDSKCHKIHRLVANAFIPNPENKSSVNHLDGNKKNNNVGNLEWCTYSENQYHAYETGLRKRPNGELNGRSKITKEDAKEIRKLCKESNYTQKEIAKMYDISAGHVSNIKRKFCWGHI